MKHLTLALGAVLALSTVTAAGDLRPERLPEATRWVAHFDLQAFARTRLWSAIQDRARREGHELPVELQFGDIDGLGELPPEVAARLAELHLDLFRDLRSVTLFGTDNCVESNLALLETSAVVHDLLDAAREIPGYARAEVDSIPMHVWSDPDDSGERAYCYLQRAGDDGTHLVLLSTDRKRIGRAALVLRGEARSLRRSEGRRLRLDPDKGSFLYFECLDGIPGLEESGEASEIAGMIDRVHLDVAERGGYLEADLRVSAADPEKTRHAARVLQGLSSLAVLAAEHEPEAKALSKLCEALDLREEGEALCIEFEFDSFELVDLLAGLD